MPETIKKPRGKRIGFIKTADSTSDIYIYKNQFQLVHDGKFVKYIKDSTVRRLGLWVETKKGGPQLRYTTAGIVFNK